MNEDIEIKIEDEWIDQSECDEYVSSTAVLVRCGCGTEQMATLGEQLECEGCGALIQMRAPP
jgi:hypothetical protein